MNAVRRRCRLAALGIAVALAACSSAEPTLYTIAPVQGPIQGGASSVIVLQTIGLARYLDRPQIVQSSENHRLDVRSNEWWGEPLGAMLGRVLTEELSQRLPQSTVINETGAVTATPDTVIELDVRRLDMDAAGNLILLPQANVTGKGRRPPVLRSFRFAVTPPAPGVPGEVQAISTAVGQLADGLTAILATGR